MAGFRKAKAEQAALKMGIYGAPGTGKTFTALLIAEGLAKLTKKRIAFVDTERGTDFYAQSGPRAVHPEAFDFDALYTRSIAEVLTAVKSLDEKQYSVIVVDSITHIWEAAKAAYSGRTTKIGTIPFQAWAQIKRPYKELMSFLLSTSMHVLILGRQSIDYQEDEETGELKALGTKMKAEGETPYEPHILMRLSCEKTRNGPATFHAFAEKDRTGVLAGQLIQLWPSEASTFGLLVEPLLPLLGGSQATIRTEDETAALDAEQFADAEAERARKSALLLREYAAKLDLCRSKAEADAVSKSITKEIKADMLTSDVAALREKYLATVAAFK